MLDHAFSRGGMSRSSDSSICIHFWKSWDLPSRGHSELMASRMGREPGHQALLALPGCLLKW